MTTVASTLKMFDAMSRPLQNITSSMNMMISTMQKMQTVTNRDVKIDKTLVAAKKQIASAEADIKKSIEDATRAQDKFRNSTQNSKKQVSDLLATAKGLAATYLSIAGAKRLWGSTVGSAMEQQNMIDTISARTGNRTQGQDIFNQLSKQALGYGQDVRASLIGAQSFMSNTMDPAKLKELNMLAMRLSKLNPTEGLEGATFSLKELMSGDYTSIAERFNMSRSMLKDSEARAAGMSGDIEGFIKGMDELLNQQNMTQEAFEKMLDSPAAKWNKIIQTFKFNLTKAGSDALGALSPLFDSLGKAFDSGTFATMFSGLQSSLTVIAKALSWVVEGLVTMVNFARDNKELMVGIFTAIGLAIAISVVPALWNAVVATWAVVGGWLAMNWVMLLIVASVGALVAAFAYFGVSAQEVVGFVVGHFYSLYARVHNMVGLLYNLFISFVEFLANVFIDPVYAVKKAFYDLAMTFGGYMYNMARSVEDFAGSFIKAILKAVNKALDGFNWLVDKVNSTFGTDIGKMALLDEDNVNVVSDSLKSVMDMLEKPTSNKNVVEFARMDYMNLKDSFDTGYNLGYNITDKAVNAISGLSKSLSGNEMFNGGAYNLGGGGMIPDIDKVKKVGKIEDKVDISSEDLKTMRELAEMKSIQNFVTLTPTVSVNTGDIVTGDDLDTIMERITATLEEEIASSASRMYE